MKAQAEMISDTRVALTIEVDAEEVDRALERAYRKVAREVNIPGFRKGKAPRKIIEARLGKEVLYEEALEELIPAAYREALRTTGTEAIDQPQVSDVEIEAGSPLRFRAEVEVLPEAELGEYKGIKLVKEIEKVEESDIDHMLEHLRDENAELTTVDRNTVENGDFVTIDFEGFIDGQPFQGGAAKGYTLEVGSGRFVEGFEEQLIGAEVGSEVEVKVNVPDDYSAEELRGKEVVFKVKVHSIKVRKLPEIDDEFAQDVSDVETLEELRAQIRSEMEEAALARANEELREQAIAKLHEASKVNAPAVLVERETEQMVNDFARSLAFRGIDLQQYLERAGITLEELAERYRPAAQRRVEANIALHTLIKREGITVGPEEVEARIERLVAQESDPEAARKRWEAPGRRDSLVDALTLEKAVDFLIEHADIEEKVVPSRGHGHDHEHDHEDGDDHGPDHPEHESADRSGDGEETA